MGGGGHVESNGTLTEVGEGQEWLWLRGGGRREEKGEAGRDDESENNSKPDSLFHYLLAV